MPRRREVPKRELLPDPVYKSPLVTKFINCMMLQGKKSVTERTFYGAMLSIGQRTDDDPLKTFKRAVDNVKPAVEVKSRRVGGSNYQVPIEVRPRRSTTLSIRWIVTFARDRRERTMAERLANELLDASNGIGSSVKKKDDTHRMAEANKAFAHYRW